MTRAELDNLLDRAAGSSSFMLATLCAAFAIVVWWRIFFVRPPMFDPLAPAPQPPQPMTDQDVKDIFVACAVVVSAVAVRYLQAAGGRFQYWAWGSFEYDVTALTCDLIVVACILFAIRRATYQVCGWFGFGIFGGVTLAAGVVSYVWG